jgi:hypothetical protein
MKTTLSLQKKKSRNTILVCEMPDIHTGGLTKGKEYICLEEIDNKVSIMNDQGKITTYYRSRFKKK